MPDFILREIDIESLCQRVAAIVVDEIRPLLLERAEPRLVDRQRMADLLGVSVPKLDRMTSSDEIPSVSIGSRRLYRPASVIDAVTQVTTMTSVTTFG